MNQKLRVVFDTNMYIAAALNPSGPSEAWLRIAGRQRRSFNLYTSRAILDEVAKKLQEKFGVDPLEATNFVNNIRNVATVVVPKERLRVVDEDPDDDMLFECAIAAKAHLIASADKVVRKYSPYRGIGICRPSDLKDIFPIDLKYL